MNKMLVGGLFELKKIYFEKKSEKVSTKLFFVRNKNKKVNSEQRTGYTR